MDILFKYTVAESANLRWNANKVENIFAIKENDVPNQKKKKKKNGQHALFSFPSLPIPEKAWEIHNFIFSAGYRIIHRQKRILCCFSAAHLFQSLLFSFPIWSSNSRDKSWPSHSKKVPDDGLLGRCVAVRKATSALSGVQSRAADRRIK